MLCFGPVARQASAVVDSYWNSDSVMQVSALKLSSTAADRGARERLTTQLMETPPLQRFPTAPQSWSTKLAALPARLHVGNSQVNARDASQRVQDVIFIAFPKEVC